MIRTEMRRAFRSKAFMVACVIVLLFLVINTRDEFEFLLGRGFLSEGIWQEKFLLVAGYDGGYIPFFCSMVVVIPYVLSYRKERDKGYRQLMVLKASGSAYRRA